MNRELSPLAIIIVLMAWNAELYGPPVHARQASALNN
jgi:hypothetical protein